MIKNYNDFIKESMETLDAWEKMCDEHDLKYFKEFQTKSSSDIEQMREVWKKIRRNALSKLNRELNDNGKAGQLFSMDVSDEELYPYVGSDSDKQTFFKYSRILDFKDGYKPKDIHIITKGLPLHENDSFRDKYISLEHSMNNSKSYKDKVACDLIHIITNEREISEKAFGAYDVVMKEVEDFYQQNKSEILHNVELFEKNALRSNYLAEKLYSKHFQKINEPLHEGLEASDVMRDVLENLRNRLEESRKLQVSFDNGEARWRDGMESGLETAIELIEDAMLKI